MGKLSGIRVINLSQFLPGPMLTVMMADHGAEVIKIAPPAGDPAPFDTYDGASHSVWFANLTAVCDPIASNQPLSMFVLPIFPSHQAIPPDWKSLYPRQAKRGARSQERGARCACAI